MCFGIIVGPVLNIFDKDLFLALSPLMSVLALSIILFEAGLHTDITKMFQELAKAAVLSITTIFSVILILGFTLSYLLPHDFTFLQAVLLGSMIGGTSTVSVVGILSNLSRIIKDISKAQVLLTLESIISDPICIITSITVIKIIMLSDVSIGESIQKIISTFILSSMTGLVAGLLWALLLNKLRGQPYTYILTLAVLFSLYVVEETVIGEGGGVMTALTFGLGIMNHRFILNKVGRDSEVMIDEQRLREFHNEIAFFIKSFFFVYIGLIVSLSIEYTLIGILIVVIIMGVRFLVVKGLGRALSFTTEQKVLAKVVYTSGLPALVMSQLPMLYDPTKQYFTNPGIYPDLCMPIVFANVTLNALLALFIAERFLPTTAQEEE